MTDPVDPAPPTPLPWSLLDLAPVYRGESVGAALAGTTHLARQAEALGYRRVWSAEHHNLPTIASAATSVLLAHVAAATSTIALGSGTGDGSAHAHRPAPQPGGSGAVPAGCPGATRLPRRCVAGARGTGGAGAGNFAPAALEQAITVYRARFEPSARSVNHRTPVHRPAARR